MLIEKIDSLTKFFFWLLLFGITFSNAIVEISIGAIIFLFVWKKIQEKDFRPPSTPVNYFIYLFLILVFISFLRSQYFAESLRGLIRAVKYALLFFALVEFLKKDEKRLEETFWVIISVASFTFLNGIFQDIFGFDILRHRMIDKLDYLHRVSSSFVHSNDFGTYIISVLLLGFVFLQAGISRKKRIALVIFFLLGFYCLLRTSSRGAWLGFLVAGFVYFLFYNKKIAFLIPPALFILILFSPHGIDRVRGLFTSERNTVWERIELWKGTWNMIKEHPFLGFGINTYSRYFPKYKPKEYPYIRYAHNSYLQLWSEIGLLGLLAFLGIVFGVLGIGFGKLKRIWIKKDFYGFLLLGLLSGYIGFLIHSGLDTNLFSLVLVTHFWVLSAYIISLRC